MPGSTMSSVVGSSASTIAIEEVFGSHVLTIEQYSKTMKLASGQFFRSNTFAAAGHRWSLKYYPSYMDHKEAYWIVIDLQLEQSFSPEVKAEFTLSLLDLNGNPVTSYFLSPRTSPLLTFVKGPSSKDILFVRRVYLDDDSGHLHNDSLRIRCDITVFKEANRGDGATAPMKSLIVVPPSDMGLHIGDLLSSKESADITLEVDGQVFPAHRNILAARSPVFKSQLFGPMKENTAACIKIEGIEARVFKAFLHFVYNDSLPEIDESETMVMAQHLLVAADMYGMARLKLICEEKLCNYIDASSVGTVIALAEQHGCDALKQTCLEFLLSSSNLKEAMLTDGFHHLSDSCPSAIMELLARLAL